MTTYKRVSGDYVIKTVNPTDIVNIESTTTVITGDLSVSGNATLLGNISGDRLFNGTSNVEIAVASGNVTIGVGGTGVATYATTGQYINGIESVTGNITGGNLRTGGQVSATGNVTGGNVISVGDIIVSQDSSAVTNPVIRFTDSNTAVTSLGSNIGAVEWYTNDGTGAGPRVTAAIKAVYADSGGNANILIQTGNTTSPSTRITVIGSTGYVGVANTAPNDQLAVGGAIYASGNLTIANVSTSGLITATGNVTSAGNVSAGNVLTGGLISATGNISGGNLIIATGSTAGSGGYSATGNITGGNLVSNGLITSTGNITGGNVITGTTLSAQANVIAGNVSAVGNITGSNISISANMSGTGVGVENIILQSGDATITSGVGIANVGSLAFNALENQVYKFEVFMPIVPAGGSTTGFSMNFSAGTCQYLVEAQTTATSAFSTSSSNTSDAVTTQVMSGTTLRSVRITGTFTHTGNVTVAVRGQSDAADLAVKAGSYLTYTRIG